MNQFVILSFGVDPLNWPSFIEIGEIACSTPAWCTHGLTLKLGASELQVQRSNRSVKLPPRTLLRQNKIVLTSETGKSAVSFLLSV